MTSEIINTEQRMLKLLQRLHSKSLLKEIQWERTPLTNVFQSSSPSYVVRVSESQEVGSAPDYYLTVRDQDGNTIERASDGAIDRAIQGAGAYRLMSELYLMARRQALGVDQALDSLLSELE